MSYVTVDVDLDDFDTDDLVREVVRRLDSTRKQKQLTQKQRREIFDKLSDLFIIIRSGFPAMLPSDTIEDQAKRELFISVWNKYTSWELEQKLK